MRDPPRILIVDDNPENVAILQARLESEGYDIVTAYNGMDALTAARDCRPDLVLLDVMMPKIDGFQVCRAIKGDASLPFMPIILVTAKAESKDVVAGLDSGGDEYLTKPVDHAALLARVRSLLRIKALHDTVDAQSEELAAWNRELERRVNEQLTEIERMGRLKRFLSPQVAEYVIAAGEEDLLKSHRRDVTIVFCDLRGFTAFSEGAMPKTVLDVLRDYHQTVGQLANEFDGTVERFAGDGVMLIFNDPVPMPRHTEHAVRMAIGIRQQLERLTEKWRNDGHQLGFGMGIARGHATLGRIGFEGRFDYAAIGTVVNLSAHLCDAAQDGQILISESVRAATEKIITSEFVGRLALKGFQKPIAAFNVVRSPT